MFKVGDKIEVVSESQGFAGRPAASVGRKGSIVRLSNGLLMVVLDEDFDGHEGTEWAYTKDEISIVRTDTPATQSESPTLLDQFAMHALTGLISNDEHIPGLETIEDVAGTYARLAYTYAQAMLKARPQ